MRIRNQVSMYGGQCLGNIVNAAEAAMTKRNGSRLERFAASGWNRHPLQALAQGFIHQVFEAGVS